MSAANPDAGVADRERRFRKQEARRAVRSSGLERILPHQGSTPRATGSSAQRPAFALRATARRAGYAIEPTAQISRRPHAHVPARRFARDAVIKGGCRAHSPYSDLPRYNPMVTSRSTVVVIVCVAIIAFSAVTAPSMFAVIDAQTPIDALFWSPSTSPAPSNDDVAIPAAPIVDQQSPRAPPLA